MAAEKLKIADHDTERRRLFVPDERIYQVHEARLFVWWIPPIPDKPRREPAPKPQFVEIMNLNDYSVEVTAACYCNPGNYLRLGLSEEDRPYPRIGMLLLAPWRWKTRTEAITHPRKAMIQFHLRGRDMLDI